MEKVVIELYIRDHPELGDIGERIAHVGMMAMKNIHPDLVTGFITVNPLNVPEPRERVEGPLFPKKELFDAYDARPSDT